MNTTIEKQENNIVKVDIEVPAKEAATYYNNAAKRLAQYVNIPGFRKGKAPRNIVEQNIGEERIKSEALESALPAIFSDVIKENDFDIVAQPYVESYDYKLGENLKITAKIELRPEVTLGQYKGLTLEIDEYKTPEDAMEKSINEMLEQHAELVVVTDRKTVNTDIIVFDFEGFSTAFSMRHDDLEGQRHRPFPKRWKAFECRLFPRKTSCSDCSVQALSSLRFASQSNCRFQT